MAKEILCPHCEKTFPSPIPDPPSLDQIKGLMKEFQGSNLTADQIDEAINRAMSPKADEHRHKTADELFNCPECSLWVERTARQYEVRSKEKPPAQPTFELGGIHSKKVEAK
ncbi:hypothetical protein ES705_16960 [subsurface metagenome]